ncbi:MAG TPA: hypothetical protein PK114_00610 [Smithellaceae bacterium]|nr:hypothetical protein [Smithellaceae bacterium]
MEKDVACKRPPAIESKQSAKVIIYPATADSIDLPDFSFRRKSAADAFVPLHQFPEQTFQGLNPVITEKMQAIDDTRLKSLLEPFWPYAADADITLNITGRRTALLKITEDANNVTLEIHWNLLIPYFDHIKTLPIVHPEILDIFAAAVFHYTAIAMKNPRAAKSKFRNLIVAAYKTRPELLLASLDIFNKQNIYHIRPTRIWLNTISAANDRDRLQIDVSAVTAVPLVGERFLEEITSFIHKIVKNYAFRYVDYLWTQKYNLVFTGECGSEMVTFEGKDIVINVRPLLRQTDWKPAVYFSLGYAVILAILQSAGRNDKTENAYLAMMKTWNRYLSFDESGERQSVCELYKLPRLPEEEHCRNLLECTIGKKTKAFIDDFITFMRYSAKETFTEKMNVIGEARAGKDPGIYFEQLSDSVRNSNAALMRRNINYGKLIEVLRNDNIDHNKLAEFLRTGRLGSRSIVDVSEWILSRTLLYDVINLPKVFKNDYKMLLKVLTKVNKSLIVYVWTLGIDNDPRYEMVSAYIAKLMNDFFVFNRVKIYEIVADPVECLEAEAVTGYLLNWASLTLEERRSIIKKIVTGLPRNVVSHLDVRSADDVDNLIRIMSIRSSGIFGFYLHQAYRWGSTNDEITNKIRSHFPELLKNAQKATLPTETVRGGAMLLLLLAQIISDERDGFAKNISITEEERKVVLGLFKQCLSWDQRHFVMMVAGIAAGYMGCIDGWIMQQFDTLLARYDGGDRVMLRSVVQFDIENLIERALITAKEGEEFALLNKIRLLYWGVDPIISNQTEKVLIAMASRYGIPLAGSAIERKDIRGLVLNLSRRMKHGQRTHNV